MLFIAAMILMLLATAWLESDHAEDATERNAINRMADYDRKRPTVQPVRKLVYASFPKARR